MNKGSKIGTKNFARLYPGVLRAGRIGLHLGTYHQQPVYEPLDCHIGSLV